jgi:hypothetical protein
LFQKDPETPEKPAVPKWTEDIDRMFSQNPELRPLSEPQVKEVRYRSTPTIVSIESSGHSPIEGNFKMLAYGKGEPKVKEVSSRYNLSIVSTEFSDHSPIEEHFKMLA